MTNPVFEKGYPDYDAVNRKDSFTVKIEQDGEDLILPLPVDLLNQMGWDDGDTLIWEELSPVSWSLRKDK